MPACCISPTYFTVPLPPALVSLDGGLQDEKEEPNHLQRNARWTPFAGNGPKTY